MAVNNYHERKNKNQIERQNASLVKHTGSIFGLFHTRCEYHHLLFGHILEDKSHFVTFDTDRAISTQQSFQMYKLGAYNPDRTYMNVRGDMMKELFLMYPGKSKQEPIFSYAHLDFCKTGYGLLDDGIYEFMRKLAFWWAIKDNFYIDITLSVLRIKSGEPEDRISKHLVDGIGLVFEHAGYKSEVINSNRYLDTTPMVNYLIHLSK